MYLLDDFDSELDEARQNAAWRVFADAEQLFLSSSRAALAEVVLGATEWTLESGRLSPRRDPQKKT